MVYRKVISLILSRISDEELEKDIITYLSENTREKVENGELEEKELQERKQEIQMNIEEVQQDIIDTFDTRGPRYNKILGAFLLSLGVNAYLSLSILQPIGIVLSLVGSVILALGLIHGIYWTYGLFLVAGYGNPSRYFRKATLNDTVDGVYGVLFIILGFAIQLYSQVSC